MRNLEGHSPTKIWYLVGDCVIMLANVPIAQRRKLAMARKENLTGECQICRKKLQKSARKDKMTCGDKSCSKKWTAFARKMRGVSWAVPKGLDRIAYGDDFKGASYHQVELALEGWKRLHDAMGEVIIDIERAQADRASELGMYHSSQFGFYSFMVPGRKK